MVYKNKILGVCVLSTICQAQKTGSHKDLLVSFNKENDVGFQTYTTHGMYG